MTTTDTTTLPTRAVALTAEQVKRYRLPATMDAKKSSSRYKGFAGKYGKHAYELEALEPTDLQDILKNSIKSAMDIDLYNKEVAAEADDIRHIAEIRAKAMALLGKIDMEG